MSTDSTRDSVNSMSPSLVDDKVTPGSSLGEQRHLSTDSTRDSGIDPDDSHKSSLAAYLPCNDNINVFLCFVFQIYIIYTNCLEFYSQ